MPSLPRDYADRIADLEKRLAATERDLSSWRKRKAEATSPVALYLARTQQVNLAADGDPPVWSYPAHTQEGLGAADQCFLPCVTLQHEITNYTRAKYQTGGEGTVNTTLEWEDRSERAIITALSPFGWLPPGTLIEIAWDGEWYRIVRVLTRFFGQVSTNSDNTPEVGESSGAYASVQARANWDTPGDGLVLLWHLDPTTGKLTETLDTEENQVEMRVNNYLPWAMASDRYELRTLESGYDAIASIHPLDLDHTATGGLTASFRRRPRCTARTRRVPSLSAARATGQRTRTTSTVATASSCCWTRAPAQRRQAATGTWWSSASTAFT